MIKYLQVNKFFDILPLQQEVRTLADQYWKQHYNTKHYEGDWSIIPLRSFDGSIDNPYSISPVGNEHIKYKDTSLLQHCPNLSAAIDFFACEKTAVRLMKLNAGSIIKEHTDQEINFESGEARFHIPVITNPEVEFYVENERVIMNEGECWYLNLSLKHRVSNLGNTDRIHLVVDCLVNDWLRDIFTDHTLNYKETATIAVNDIYKPEDKIKIIQQLRSLNTAVANELADKMEAETNN